MDKRLDLLNYLLTQKRAVPNRELQSVLNVSRRTVINYVNEINGIEENTIFSSSRGYQCMDAGHARKAFRQLESVQAFDSFEKRCDFLLQELLLKNSHPSLDELANRMFLSPVTLNNELQKYRSAFKEYNLYLRLRNNRLYLIGHERDKHSLTMKLLSQELEHSHFSLQTLQKLFLHVNITTVETVVKQTLKRHSYFMDDFSCLNYVLHLAICTESALSSPALQTETEIKELQKKYPLSDHIFKIVEEIYLELKQIYHVEFSPEQILETSMLTATRIVSANIDNLHFEQLNGILPAEVRELLTVIISSVHDIYGIDLKTDHFMTRFAFHLKNLMERISNHLTIRENTFITIKNDYPFLYVIAEYIASIINQRIGSALSENEVSYIALHLGVLMEEKNTFSHKLNCVLVIYNYYNMGIAVFEHLKQMTDNLYLADIVTSYEQICDPENVDLILTTLPAAPVFDIPVVKIHTIPTRQDYEQIIAKANELAQGLGSKELSQKIRRLFKKELFFPATAFPSRESAIEYLCRNMEGLGYVDANFKAEILYHEKIAPSAYRNVALPHSLASDEQRRGLSTIAVALNNHPIPWADNQVDFIFLLSLSGEDRPLFKDVFRILSDFLQKPENCERLKRCTSFDAFIHLLIHPDSQ